MLISLTDALTAPMPKVVSRRSHALGDYVAAGGFLLMGRYLWRRNRRAAMVSCALGGIQLAGALLTDYPGGLTDAVSIPLHDRIDLAVATAAASAPGIFAFHENPEKGFFLLQAGMITLLKNITKSDGKRTRGFERKPYRVA